MKINDYYQDAANLSLNGSLAALLPIILMTAANLSYLHNEAVFVLTVPFFLYSFLCFQLYLFRKRQSITINRNLSSLKPVNGDQSLFSARHLLVLFHNAQSPQVLLYFPDGQLAGSIKRYRLKGLRKLKFSMLYVLYNSKNEAIACFGVKRKREITIEVYDKKRNCLGFLKKTRLNWLKSREELYDTKGTLIGFVEGSGTFMDEKIIDQYNQQVSRLRRGWMPVEWSPLFPEPNTPVLSFDANLSEQEKLLRMSFLINEFFIER